MLDREKIKRASEAIERLERARVARVQEIEDLSRFETREFLTPGQASAHEFDPCSTGTTWCRDREAGPDDRRTANTDVVTGEVSSDLEVGKNVWFRLRGSIPDEMAGHPVSLRFVARPLQGDDDGQPRVESLCFRDGDPVKSFDNGHDSLRLVDDADGGESFDLLVETGTTTLWGRLGVERFVLETAELYAERPEVAALHRHASLLFDLAEAVDEDSPNYGRLLDGLVDASHLFSFDADSEAEYAETATAALDRLQDLESTLTTDLSNDQITAVGHAHIDPAWRWPWSEGVRKTARSFSNALALTEDYPEFTFTQSQPHIYDWIRNQYPDQWDRVRESVADGQWHPEGALWVESDINNVGEEALARQFLLGKRYFREEFDVDPQVTFLPDVFGYSPGLPGIATAADCPYFLTQKMSWNEINEFPHNTFRWEGIDGSEVLAHFPPVDTYNGTMDVGEVTKSVYNDAQNGVSDDRAYLYGWGDGGGGPTREMIENGQVIDDIDALPDIEWGTLDGLFDRLDSNREEYPVWSGELYLEKHRGTLTTQARTKRNNRKGEHALREAELWSSLARASDPEFAYEHDTLQRAWKILLFNQFHDILPGSSVQDVYADADRDYEEVFDIATAVRDSAIDSLVNTAPDAERLCVMNPLSWSRRTVAVAPAIGLLGDEVDEGAVRSTAVDDGSESLAVQRTTAGIADAPETQGDVLLVETPELPEFGAATVEVTPGDAVSPANPFDVSEERLSNGLVTVEFADDGTVSVEDELAGREVLAGAGNRLVVHPDQPRQFDAWDIDEAAYERGERLPAPDTSVVERGPVRATVSQRRTFGDSEIVQEISLYRDTKRVDFRTRVEWDEEEKLLKTYFPAAVETSTATYDTHFGHHQRATHDNTSWDAARWEEAGGQWVDVSDPDYGVALLNDCKYGVHVDGAEMSLSLLRAPNAPDPTADRGTHVFTYSLLPHEQGAVAAGVNEAAHELNATARAVPTAEPLSFAPVSVADESVVVTAVKRGEDREDELVFRLYEAAGTRTTTTVGFDFPVEGVAEANLVEDRTGEVPLDGSSVRLEFDPFEIRTLLVRLG